MIGVDHDHRIAQIYTNTQACFNYTIMPPQTNTAFQTALQRHLDTSDIRSFASDATPDDVLSEIKEYEKANKQSSGRRYASRFSALIRNFQCFFSAVNAFVSSNPEIAGLVWGGFRFIIQVRGLSKEIFVFPDPPFRRFPILHLTSNRSLTCSRRLAKISTFIKAMRWNCIETLTV